MRASRIALSLGLATVVVAGLLCVSRKVAIHKSDRVMALAPAHGWVATHARFCIVRDTQDRMHLGWRVVYDTDQALVDFPPHFAVGLSGKMMRMYPADKTIEERLKQDQTVEHARGHVR